MTSFTGTSEEPKDRKSVVQCTSRTRILPLPPPSSMVKTEACGLPFPSVDELRKSWWIGPVEVPSRLVLAPMAGVSVQAFRRQGRRFGAGLVCSEMVSCAGLHTATSARSAIC